MLARTVHESALTEDSMRASILVQLSGIIALGAAPLYAQTPPPIHGVTGTIATDATIKAEGKAANTIVVKTEDGVEHVYHAVTGGKRGKGVLADLTPGTTVLVHYRADHAPVKADRAGTDGLTTTEGIATKIDGGKKEITVRYDDGRIETLKLTERESAKVDANISADARIVVYSTTGSSQKVARYFTTVKER